MKLHILFCCILQFFLQGRVLVTNASYRDTLSSTSVKGRASENCTIAKHDPLFPNSSILEDCSLCSCLIPGSSPVSFREQCEVTEEIVLKIMELIRTAYEIVVPPSRLTLIRQGESICNSSRSIEHRLGHVHWTVTQESCQEILEQMEAFILRITEEIKLLLQWIDDPGDVIPVVAQLKSCVRCLNQQIDDFIKDYGGQLGDLRDELNNMKQCYIDAVNYNTEEILKLQAMIDQKNFDLISAHISGFNSFAAVQLFIELNNASLLEPLIVHLYNSTDMANLFDFVIRLPEITRKVTAYAKIKALMEAYGHMETSSHVITFKRALKQDVSAICNSSDLIDCPTIPLELHGIIRLIDIQATRRLAEWAASIRKGEFTNIIRFGSTHIKNLAGYGVNDTVGDLITRTYKKDHANFPTTLAFITSLQWDSQRCEGFSALIVNLTPDGKTDLLKIAYEMKKAMDNLLEPDPHGLMKQKFESLRDKTLPHNVQSIAWHKTCTLESIYNEFLYMDSRTFGNFNFGVVTAKNSPSNKDWAFIPLEKGSTYEFRIKNGENGDHYLGPYVPWKNQDDMNGHVSATLLDEHVWSSHYYNWRVEFSDDPNKIRIYDYGRKAYLIAADNGQTFLYLSGVKVASGEWKIQCEIKT